MAKVFTTGQVAKICKVTRNTVSKWFDSGRLDGYRIPCSQDRRIREQDLVKFLKEHGMPLGNLEDETTAKVLVATQDEALLAKLKTELTPGFTITSADSPFNAGYLVNEIEPDAIFVDFSLGRIEAGQIIHGLRCPTDRDVIIIALVLDLSRDTWSYCSLANEKFIKPFDFELLAQRLCTLVGDKKS